MEKINRLIFLFLLAVIVPTAGCAGFVHHSDPLAGWNFYGGDYLDKTITNDYKDYIKKLPPGESFYVQDYNVHFFEDGTGQHAVRISIPLNGSWREHVLIYDKDDTRVKVIKYVSGRYVS
jgi:hypothetical protein